MQDYKHTSIDLDLFITKLSTIDEADRRYGSKQVEIYHMPSEVFKEKIREQNSDPREIFERIKSYIVLLARLDPCLSSADEKTGDGEADVIFTGFSGSSTNDVTLYTFDLSENKFLREEHITVPYFRAEPVAVGEQREWLGMKPLEEEGSKTRFFTGNEGRAPLR